MFAPSLDSLNCDRIAHAVVNVNIKRARLTLDTRASLTCAGGRFIFILNCTLVYMQTWTRIIL